MSPVPPATSTRSPVRIMSCLRASRARILTPPVREARPAGDASGAHPIRSKRHAPPGPRRSPAPRGAALGDRVRGHRKRAARAAGEHWTGPRELTAETQISGIPVLAPADDEPVPDDADAHPAPGDLATVLPTSDRNVPLGEHDLPVDCEVTDVEAHGPRRRV